MKSSSSSAAQLVSPYDPSATQRAGCLHDSTPTRVEITVQSLTGISVSSDIDENSLLKASVSFSGSANNMQVGSSILCPETGLLIVESEPLLMSHCNKQQLEFKWQTIDQPPHLTVSAICVASAAKTPLQKANRDSTIVKLQDLLDGSSSTKLDESVLSDFSRLTTSLLSARSTNSTAFWSDAMPDILELNLRVGDDKGVAFLVFFGHKDDRGTCLMDLPIRRPANCKMSSCFTDEARLRVQVTVVVPAHSALGALPPITSCSTGSSASTDHVLEQHPLVYTRSFLEQQVASLLQTFQSHEHEAMEQRRTQKRAMDVEVPLSSDIDDDRYQSTPPFCSFLNWDQIREIVTACRGSTYGTRRDTGCDSSTIGTRDSMEL
jgi:hypothetical protein